MAGIQFCETVERQGGGQESSKGVSQAFRLPFQHFTWLLGLENSSRCRTANHSDISNARLFGTETQWFILSPEKGTNTPHTKLKNIHMPHPPGLMEQEQEGNLFIPVTSPSLSGSNNSHIWRDSQAVNESLFIFQSGCILLFLIFSISEYDLMVI